MGSITKRTKVDKTTGKTVTAFRVYVRREGFASKSKVCSTLHEAKEWMRNNDGDAALKRHTSGITLRELVELFVEAPPSEGTRFREASHLDFWTQKLGSMKVSEIARGDINAAKAKLQTKRAMRSTPGGPQITTKALAPATVNRYLATLSSLFNYALAHDIIDAHPMKAGRVKKLKEGNGRTRILTSEEEAKLYSAAEASTWPMLRLFLRVCLTSAARKSEVLNLRWSDLRLDDSVAILSKTKNGRARALPLVADVKVALEAAAKERPLHNDLIFFDPKHPERAKKIDVVWKACREAAGLLNDRDDPLDRVVLHSTRHTGVTRMLKGGANLAQAAAVSGHQTLAALKRYEHLAAADSVEIAQRLLAGGGVSGSK